MSFSIIAAIGKNYELGKKGGLCFHISADLKYFKEKTLGHKVLMGENTFKSLPKTLPNREYLVLSYNDIASDGIAVFHSIDEVLAKYKDCDEEIFVIGGGMVYKSMLPFCNKLYLTEIEAEDKEADTFFPRFDQKLFSRSILGSGEEDGLKYNFVIYERN